MRLYRNIIRKGSTYKQYYSRIKHKNVRSPATVNDLQKISDQNPGLRIRLYYPHEKDYFLGVETKVTEVSSEVPVKNVDLVFFQYRNAKTLEIEGACVV